MGSQTLEILRQGIWASITGGWFYDPHQDVFSNTLHLYLWLFLLCLPLVFYIYFPPILIVWYFYCSLVAVVFTFIKLLNYGFHHMYDTTECVHEQVQPENWPGEKKEEEGIELQVLSKPTTVTSIPQSQPVNPESSAPPKFTDSLDSNEFQSIEPSTSKCNNSIDLKVEVYGNASSESIADATETTLTELACNPVKGSIETVHTDTKKLEHLQSKGNQKKLRRQTSSVSQESTFLDQPSHEIGSENSSPKMARISRRHSNFDTIYSHPSMKPTGSLELNYIDKNFLNQALTSEGFYFKAHNRRGGVRRIRSTALETSCPPTLLKVHPNSLEILGGSTKNARNPLPPPSSKLVRNQHLNLCPYYGSEIVYPIAEQSDEHQTSHDPDSDMDSSRNSESDYDETNEESRSPLLVRLQHVDSVKMIRAVRSVPNNEKDLRRAHECYPRFREKCEMNASYNTCFLSSVDAECASAHSTNRLDPHDHAHSQSSATLNAPTDCYATDTEYSDRKYSDSSQSSESSVDYDTQKNASIKLRSPNQNSDPFFTNKFVEAVNLRDAYVSTESERMAKRRTRRNKGKCRSCSKPEEHTKRSSLELDLDWLFDDENEHINCSDKHQDYLGTKTISLEHDVSKVLQEPTPSRNLGAIPKRTRPNPYREEKSPKTESDRRNKYKQGSSRRIKENKITQTLKPTADNFVEGLECLVVPAQLPPRLKKLSMTRRNKNKMRPRNDFYQEASSSSSNNELSSLLPLPSTPLLSALLATRQNSQNIQHPICVCLGNEHVRLERYPSPTPGVKAHVRTRRSIHTTRNSNPEPIVTANQRDIALTSSIWTGYGTHRALSFEDTSHGSVHCFLDERGNWITYTFNDKGLGTQNTNLPVNARYCGKVFNKFVKQDVQGRVGDVWESNSAESTCNSSVSIIIDGTAPPSAPHHPIGTTSMIPTNNRFRINAEPLRHRFNGVENAIESLRDARPTLDSAPDVSARHRFRYIPTVDTNPPAPRTKSYYKFKVLPWTYMKIGLDRLNLLAILDRNFTLSETLFSIILGILVSVFGAILLYIGFYEDLLAFIFCLVIASCQYSLLKSAQPDAASPTHGFNRIIVYSRPIYFCLISSVILLLHVSITNGTETSNQPAFKLYGIRFPDRDLLIVTRNFLVNFILFFPVIFSVGLFPQINTFIMYLLEQIDMHVFGGNAMSSLLASFYCVFRSMLAVIVLYGLAYGSLIEEKSSQHILFSMFCAGLVTCSYHLSRSASDPTHIWNIVKKHLWPPDVYREYKKAPKKPTYPIGKSDGPSKEKKSKEGSNGKVGRKGEELIDPLPHKLQKTVNARLKSDIILCGLIAVFVFGLHASTVFSVLQPELSPVLWCIAGGVGIVLHYFIPQLRKQLPWLCIARPVLQSHEYAQYQVRGPAKVMWFEIIYVYLCFVERNMIYPLIFIAALTEDAPKIVGKFGALGGALITVLCGIKCLRGSYSNQSAQYLILTFTVLFFKYDHKVFHETFLIDYFVMSIIFYRVYELLLKLQFVVTYIAPWQITWGSAFHAFAQPFSVPHSAMLFSQALISAALSTPLNPFLGSAIFLTSYVRPIKFWERDYNTRRVDHSNTPLSSHLDRNLGADDNNLNSIFYEHLTRSLQHSLCGDLILGRWGPVSQGDCFVLASDYLNCLVHIIELGNGLVTFQMRGLEFRGTYCQQREVEAITEGVEENDGCCCCDPGHLPNILSPNAAFTQRWLAWEVTAAKYVLEGYSISDNSAISMLQVFDFRKVLITYYVKSIIFYAIRSPKILDWLQSPTIHKALHPMQDRNFVDLDPVFNINIDEDFDMCLSGMTRNMFFQVYGEWISYCTERWEKNIDASINSSLVLLCFALSLLGRRALGAVSHNVVSSVEFFLYGLHALFKGDFRITCTRDEWVFSDMDLLRTVVAPGVRMSLKLHQDHFMSPDEYDEMGPLFDAICKHEEELVISHEGDPVWRNAVLSGTPSLLALRHVLDEGADEYKIIMLNKRYLTFRVIKVNRECVRGLWAGQQQELVYLRNRNPERGSIQNAKQALRNIINSSCDQPIGYPIYVSPLTTSYAETNEQLCSIIGGSLSLNKIRNYIVNTFSRVRKRCREGCSSGGSQDEMCAGQEGVYAMTPMAVLGHHTTGSLSTDGSHFGGSMGRGASLSRTSLGNRGSLASMGKPTSSTLASLAGLFKERDERAVSQAPDGQTKMEDRPNESCDNADKEVTFHRVRIIDPNLVYDCINLGRRIDVNWPDENMRAKGGRSHWRDWLPETGMEGQVVHRWIPHHRDPNRRSHVDRTILLVNIDDKYVPIAESGVQDLGAEV